MSEQSKLAQLEEALAGARAEITFLKKHRETDLDHLDRLARELAALKSHDRCNSGIRSLLKTAEARIIELEAENEYLRLELATKSQAVNDLVGHCRNCAAKDMIIEYAAAVKLRGNTEEWARGLINRIEAYDTLSERPK